MIEAGQRLGRPGHLFLVAGQRCVKAGQRLVKAGRRLVRCSPRRWGREAGGATGAHCIQRAFLLALLAVLRLLLRWPCTVLRERVVLRKRRRGRRIQMSRHMPTVLESKLVRLLSLL